MSDETQDLPTDNIPPTGSMSEADSKARNFRRGSPLTGHDGSVHRVLFSQDSSRLFTGSEDGTVRSWDLNAEHPGATSIRMKGHKNSILSLALSPDGQWLVSSSYESVRVWPLRIESLMEIGQSAAGRDLTQAERNLHRLR